MPPDQAALAADLADETSQLLSVLDGRPPGDLTVLTPAEGWDIADQVGHLAYFDEQLLVAIRAPVAFSAAAAELMKAGGAPDDLGSAPSDVVERFAAIRAELVAVLERADPRDRVPWYGPSMSIASATTARLMETWAHGQDVAAALGTRLQPTGRLRHVAELGVRTFGFSFAVRGLPVPDTAVRLELAGPTGETWVWGAPESEDSIVGEAEGFCLVVTQRCHVSRSGLEVRGATAEAWMAVAQAFAGAPTLASPSRTPRNPIG